MRSATKTENRWCANEICGYKGLITKQITMYWILTYLNSFTSTLCSMNNFQPFQQSSVSQWTLSRAVTKLIHYSCDNPPAGWFGTVAKAWEIENSALLENHVIHLQTGWVTGCTLYSWTKIEETMRKQEPPVWSGKGLTILTFSVTDAWWPWMILDQVHWNFCITGPKLEVLGCFCLIWFRPGMQDHTHPQCQTKHHWSSLNSCKIVSHTWGPVKVLCTTKSFVFNAESQSPATSNLAALQCVKMRMVSIDGRMSNVFTSLWPEYVCTGRWALWEPHRSIWRGSQGRQISVKLGYFWILKAKADLWFYHWEGLHL